jgi:hypothetical protein
MRTPTRSDKQLDGFAPAHVIDAGQQCHRAHQSWAERRTGNLLRVVSRARCLSAARAQHLVPPVLGRVRLERGQLGELVALGVRVGSLGQRPAAAVLTCSGKKSTTSSTCSAASSTRREPRCPGWPPRRFPLPDLPFLRFPRAPGESLDGGRLELPEFRPSRSVSSATWRINTSMRASCSAIRASFAANSASSSAMRSSASNAERRSRFRSARRSRIRNRSE